MSLGKQNLEIQIQESFMHSKSIVNGSDFQKFEFWILRLKIHIWFFNRKVRESFEHYEFGDRNWKDESNPIKREEGLGFLWLLGKIKENRTQGASTIKKQFSNPGKFKSGCRLINKKLEISSFLLFCWYNPPNDSPAEAEKADCWYLFDSKHLVWGFF